MSEANPTPAPPPKKNHLWIYFFAFLLIASVGVTVFMIRFNQSIQLKPEDIDANRKLWEARGPKNYNLFYTEQVNDDDRKTVFAVKVRASKVTEVLMNGKPLAPTTEDGIEHDPRPYHSMEAIFRNIERFMDIDQGKEPEPKKDSEPKKGLDQKKEAPRVYCIANFDPETGAVLRYIRRVMGTRQRVELNLKVEAAE
jgi:hypothetical protein